MTDHMMNRSNKIRQQARQRAQGKCECCGFDAEKAIAQMILVSAMGHLNGFAVTRKRAIELICEAKGWPQKKALLECDHRIPLALGGTDTLAGVWMLCLGCHEAKPDLKVIPKCRRKAKRQAAFAARMAEKAGG